MNVTAKQGQINLAWVLLCGFICHVWHGRHLEQTYILYYFSQCYPTVGGPVHGFTLYREYQVLWPLQISQLPRDTFL